LLLAYVVLTGCAATRFENYPLTAGHANPERRTIDVSRSDRPLILVAISGGGSRAAALGWVVLRELSAFQYASDGKTRRLTDDIGVVSSVSGGSVIAAHFALNGAEGLDRFAPDFLERDNMRTLELEAADPITWFRLAIAGSARVDIVEQLFDRQLFRNRTFAELNQRGKPFLILNATDMASGEVFAFTPKRFDDICSDLDKQPISAAVGASSAVPVAVSPVAMQNYSVSHCQGRTMPQWIESRLKGRFAPYVNLQEYKLARYANDLRRGTDSVHPIDYLYLLDGGLADNLGIHGLLQTISSPYAAPITADPASGLTENATILEAINAGLVKKLAVILINARADALNKIDQKSSRPGIAGMIGSVTSIPINSASASVSAQMDLLMGELDAAAAAAQGNPQFTGVKVYAVQVDFDQLRVSDPEQRELRIKANEIPTLWTITNENLNVIEQVGTTLLRQHPCFQRLLLDMSIDADFVDPSFARTGCRQATD
jgi:NTE family protein